MQLAVYCLDYRLRWLIRLTWVCIVASLSACSLLIGPDRSILTDSPCAAPCWQGITPGSSMTVDAIKQILKQQPTVGEIWQPQFGTVAWYWQGAAWQKTPPSSVSVEGGKIHDIDISFDFELTIQDVINKYGPPEAVNMIEAGSLEDPYVGMNLFYPTRGLYFKARIVPSYAPDLEPTSKVFEGVYVGPAESIESWQRSAGDIGLRSWPGYGKLDTPTPSP